MARRKETERQLPLMREPGGTQAAAHAHAVVYIHDQSVFVHLEEGKTVVLGRDDEADVVVDTATVSRRHVALRWSQGELSLSDCGSTNGTYVDGKRAHGEVLLDGGQEIAIGDATIVVGITSALPHGTADHLRREKLPFDPIVADPVSARLFSLVDRVAPIDGTVLLLGETGVGKDVVARQIHERSHRKAGPFVHVNCGAIPSGLFERELFGHEKGSFTGAGESREGLFECASLGTLFLDEIGEIPLQEQTGLLRAIEHRKTTRVGGTEEISLDIRIVAATNRDLEALVSQGRFREDLFYRLTVLNLFVAALRDRRGDVRPLAQRFFDGICHKVGRPLCALSDDIAGVLERQPWPGNVRQLRNVVERATLLASGPAVEVSDFLSVLHGDHLTPEALSHPAPLKELVEEVERHAITQALEASGQNQGIAAEKLGVSRRTLIYKMRRYNIPGRGRGVH